MPYQLLETYCRSPKPAGLGEDRLVASEPFVAVIDGATSSGPVGGVPGGVVAAETIAEALRALPPDCDARGFADRATEALRARLGSEFERAIARPSAAVVVWSAPRQEIWRIGDCHFRVDDTKFVGEKEIDRIAYGYRCAVLRARLRLGLTSEAVERTIPTLEQPFMALVSTQHAFVNADIDDPLAYGAIDGSRVPDRFVEVVSTRGAREIVLCSDGFVEPSATLAAALADLERLKNADPLLVALYNGSRPFPPGATLFDDATYVRLRP